MLVEYCFSSHSNIITLQMKDDSEVHGTMENSDFTTVNKVAIVFDDDANTSYNSVDDSGLISYVQEGIISMNLGDSSLPVGSYIAYFNVYYDGVELPVEWEPRIRVRKL